MVLGSKSLTTIFFSIKKLVFKIEQDSSNLRVTPGSEIMLKTLFLRLEAGFYAAENATGANCM